METKGRTHYGPRSIETGSGFELILNDPKPHMINIHDIARGLSNLCRFNGQVRRFYSVAEHSVLVSDLMRASGQSALSFAGLMHDSAEAYLGDVIAPIKMIMRERYDGTRSATDGVSAYDDLTCEVEAAIGEAFGLRVQDADHKTIKWFDNRALRIETHALVPSCGRRWDWPEDIEPMVHPPDEIVWNGGLPPVEAQYLFLSRFEELKMFSKDETLRGW